MNVRPLAKFVAAASIALLAVSLAGCASESPATPPSQTTAPVDNPVTKPSAAPEDVENAEPIVATCENIISASTLEQFTNAKWTAKNHEFMIGETTLTSGIYCVWGDYDGPASDNVAIFGWSPITKAEATQTQNELIAAGWIREADDTGVYITENPEFALALDENGYGMTYLYGDDWVTVSDRKQSLQLISAPRE